MTDLGGRPHSPFRDKVLALAASGENLSYKQMAIRLGTTKGVIAGQLDRLKKRTKADRRFGHPDVPRIRKARAKVREARAKVHKGKNHINVVRLNKARRAGALTWGAPGFQIINHGLMRDVPDEQIARTVTLLDLTYGQCKWPLPGDNPIYFCGADAKDDCSYCVAHARRAFRPAKAA